MTGVRGDVGGSCIIKDMRILGIQGSPTKDGNTALLLDKFLLGAQEAGASIRSLGICDYQITPCFACYQCEAEGICPVKDGMRELFPLIKEYEIVVLASPIFFSGVPAQLKAMIDRCQSCWIEKYRLKIRRPKRSGYFLSTAARHEFDGAIATVKAFFITLDIEYRGDILVGGLEGKTIYDRPRALEEAYRLGQMSVREGESG